MRAVEPLAMTSGVKIVYPSGKVILVCVPLRMGTSAAENAVVMAPPPPTKLRAQYWPAGMAVLAATSCAPASPKLCLSILLVIGVVYGNTDKETSLYCG